MFITYGLLFITVHHDIINHRISLFSQKILIWDMPWKVVQKLNIDETYCNVWLVLSLQLLETSIENFRSMPQST
jgi:hypothetical protein